MRINIHFLRPSSFAVAFYVWIFFLILFHNLCDLIFLHFLAFSRFGMRQRGQPNFFLHAIFNEAIVISRMNISSFEMLYKFFLTGISFTQILNDFALSYSTLRSFASQMCALNENTSRGYYIITARISSIIKKRFGASIRIRALCLQQNIYTHIFVVSCIPFRSSSVMMIFSGVRRPYAILYFIMCWLLCMRVL